MKQYVNFVDGLPLILKIILALPCFDWVVFGIYRIAKGKVIVGILWILLGWTILWIIDIYTLATKGKITFLV